MKSLVRKILSNRISILLRNTLNIKPVRISKYYLNENISMSDAFLFRTDSSFKTILRFSDIPNIFYDYKETSVEIKFYDFNNNFLKKKIIYPTKINNELIIDKFFLDDLETYGHFYIFHNINDFDNKNVSFSNRCYVGFSKSDKNYSFVHGNTYVKAKDLKNGIISSNFSNISLLANFKYVLQENFSNIDYVELFFCNPTSKDLRLKINEKKINLLKNCDQRFKLNDASKIEIISNCANLRPIVFTHKGEFYDVHHG